MNNNTKIYIEIPFYDFNSDNWFELEHLSYFTIKNFLNLMTQNFNKIEFGTSQKTLFFIGTKK